MIKNACAVLMCSRGTPMFLSGDEFGDTRFGNNNPYCQDNLISWLDWNLLGKNADLFEFFRYMIAFRMEHPAIRKDLEPSYIGFPSMSIHNLVPWENEHMENSYAVCVLFAGYDEDEGREDLVYIAVNAHWYAADLTLPDLPEGYVWKNCSQYRRSKTTDLHRRPDARVRKDYRPRRTFCNCICWREIRITKRRPLISDEQ